MRIIDAAQCYALPNRFLGKVKYFSCTGTAKQRNARESTRREEKNPSGQETKEKTSWNRKADWLARQSKTSAPKNRCHNEDRPTNSTVAVTHYIKGRSADTEDFTVSHASFWLIHIIFASNTTLQLRTRCQRQHHKTVAIRSFTDTGLVGQLPLP
jgi:hypothetical protein